MTLKIVEKQLEILWVGKREREREREGEREGGLYLFYDYCTSSNPQCSCIEHGAESKKL